jgi:regulatory protein
MPSSCPVPTGGPASRRWISPRPSDARSALDTAVRFLAQRPRSEYEVRQRLRRAGIDEATLEGVLVQLRQHQLVDDRAFADYWVQQRQTFRPRGARLLRAELARLGVDRGGVEAAVTATEPTAATDAYRAAARHAVRLRNLDERTFCTRLGQWLARRGFDWETITPVVQRLWSETAQ